MARPVGRAAPVGSPPGRAGERGAVFVLFALLLTAMIAIAALVLDLGALRAGASRNQSLADLAVLAAADALADGDFEQACRDAVGYLGTNSPELAGIDPVGFCRQPGQDVTTTVCSQPGGKAQVSPTVSVGDYTVSLRFPVPDAEIADARSSPGVNDGLPCERMRVLVSSREPVLFGAILGSKGLDVTRSATVRAGTREDERIPALWLLDPRGCTALAVSGGSKVTVGHELGDVPGIIKVDSDGTACQSNQVTISSSGSGTRVQAWPPDDTPPGVVSLRALPPGATTCVAPACDPADVNGGRLAPQPTGSLERATRAPADWRYNCRPSYPDYLGLPIAECDEGSPAYLDLLVAAIGTSGNPDLATYQRWRAHHPCNPSGEIVVAGNWWVDCPGGLRVGQGTPVTINGNAVFDGGLTMTTGGSLSVNTQNPSANLPASCVPPAVTTPCISTSSAGAALMYFRSGDWDLQGGNLDLHHTMAYLADGYVKVTATAPPRWSAPTEGPFALLSLWAEASSSKFTINGGAGVELSGIFFTPYANPMSLSGGGDWGQLRAQFIAYRVAVSGGGVLDMVPDATMLALPPRNQVLIR